MDARTFGWLSAFCLGLLAWLYYDVSSVKIDYDWHSFLVNASTGEKMRPIDVLDLDKVIRPTEEYVNATNAIKRLFDTAQQTNYENTYSAYHHYSDQRQLEQSGWPVADQTRCARELTWIQEQLSAHKEYAYLGGSLGQELTHLIDSYGKPEAGFYSGVLTWPGSYDQCKRVTLNEGTIKTRYCLASMRFKQWPAVESGQPKTRIKIGICIPETCDTLSFESQRDKIDALTKLELSEFLRENLILESMFCLPDERSPVRQLSLGGRIFLALIGSWLALMVLATLVIKKSSAQLKSIPKEQVDKSLLSKSDSSKALGLHAAAPAAESPLDRVDQEPTNSASSTSLIKIAQALSFQNSWKMFESNPYEKTKAANAIKDEGSAHRVDLALLNFIKFSMAFAIVFCHAYMLVNLYSTSISHRIAINTGPTFYAFANFSKLVDTFFFINGLLSAYTLLRKFSITQLASPLTWLMINLRTQVRLTPTYMLVFWFAKTIEVYTGEGPWWDYGVFRYSVRGMCMHEPWWTSIPYFARSGSQPASSCAITGWFIVALSQISLVMPLVIYLLYKLSSHRSRYALLAFITLISSLQTALKVFRQSTIRGEAFGSYGAFLMILFEKFESLGGMSSVGRLVSVAYGCYAGYLLHLYETGAIREWPRWLTSEITLALIGFAHLFVLVIPISGYLYLNYSAHVTSKIEFVGTYVVNMIIWPVLNGMLIINLATVFNTTRSCRALSHPFWHTANKLGLAIYLVHWDVLIYLITSYQGGPSKGYITDVVKLTSLGSIITLAASFLITILFDMPVTSLLTLLLDKLQAIGRVRAKSPASNAKQENHAQRNLSRISAAQYQSKFFNKASENALFKNLFAVLFLLTQRTSFHKKLS